MLLLVDIGNTSTTIGICTNKETKAIAQLSTMKADSNIEEHSNILRDLIKKHQLPMPTGGIVCSVVPDITNLLITAVKNSFGIEMLNLHHNLKTGLEFSIKNIESLGADRIANAVAAGNLYKGNLIVVDFGTATTFCVITENMEYRGGAIMPGPGLSADVLAEKTARLPRVELKAPDNILGNDTTDNIRNGVILGHAGAVERIIKEIAKEMNGVFTVIATGGYASLIVPHLKIDHTNSILTLEGLRFIYKLNT